MPLQKHRRSLGGQAITDNAVRPDMVTPMDDGDDVHFRAGPLMGRMQTLEEVMARLNATPMDGT